MCCQFFREDRVSHVMFYIEHIEHSNIFNSSAEMQCEFYKGGFFGDKKLFYNEVNYVAFQGSNSIQW